jgi:hypothetical protein
MSRVLRFGSIVLFGVLPVLVLGAVFVDAIQGGVVAIDFRQFYRGADAILRGVTPYPSATDSLEPWAHPYVYPPLPAILTIPLKALSLEAAGLIVMATSVASALAILRVLGVRDWRCYGLMLLWPPVISAIQTGNPTLYLALAAALAWRFRTRPMAAAASIGFTLAVKFFLWPLVVWLAATRRVLSALLACAVGAGLIVLSWAVIGFAGLTGYPDLLHRLDDTVGRDSYSARMMAIDLGLRSGLASALWLAAGLGVLAAVVVVARRGDDRGAFILAMAAAFSLSPLVWLHYFAYLVVVVAVAQPRLGPVWFVPLAMFISTGSGHPTSFRVSWTLAAGALTIVLALRAARTQTVPTREVHASPATPVVAR